MSLDESGYTGSVLQLIASANAKVGDQVKISHDDSEFIGILMPRSQVGSDPNHIVIKLESGYNIGIRLSENTTLEKIKTPRRPKRKDIETTTLTTKGLPKVSVLSTGGTIASRVDYRTGAVNPALTAQDFYDSIPELQEHANITAKIMMSVLSENVHPSDWEKIARSVASQIRNSADGVVVAHGTDTLAFTATALAFALQDLPVPVALVGSQRSSDRPSSDASLNLIGAIDLVGRVHAAEVMVVMHGVPDDSFLYAHRAARSRKLHTSRRDAFQSVNALPLFKIDNGESFELNVPLRRRDKDRKLKLKAKFDDRVALVKTHPGIHDSFITSLIDSDYKGIIIEGTGLGHIPECIYPGIRKAIAEDIIVAMTSQCINGRVDMNVYRTGVELLEMGVISCEDMLSEVALVKLMWLLANQKDSDKIRVQMVQSLVGEIDMRSELSEYTGNSELM